MLKIQEQLLQEEDDGGAPGAGAREQEAAAGGQGRGQPRVEECVKSYHLQNDAKCRFVDQQNLFIQNKKTTNSGSLLN